MPVSIAVAGIDVVIEVSERETMSESISSQHP
jgi:hypothetical protein